MTWCKLIDLPEDNIFRGAVLRFPAKYPYEDIVDFMVFDPSEDGKGMGLITSSGYKSGLICVVLPLESGERAISKSWLLDNWKYWVYPDCDVSEVFVIVNYPEPSLPDRDMDN